MQWGKYHTNFLLNSRPYVAAALIGATSVSYNITLYGAIPTADNLTTIPIKAMVMTATNLSSFQVRH